MGDGIFAPSFIFKSKPINNRHTINFDSVANKDRVRRYHPHIQRKLHSEKDKKIDENIKSNDNVITRWVQSRREG